MTMLGHIMRGVKGKMFRIVPGMIACTAFEDFIVDYLEDRLSPNQRRVFEWHIRLCRECKDYLAAYRRSIAMGKEALTEETPDIPDDLVHAILAARAADR